MAHTHLTAPVWNYANICIYGLNFHHHFIVLHREYAQEINTINILQSEAIRKKKTKKKICFWEMISKKKKSKFDKSIPVYHRKNRKQMCPFVNKNPLFALRGMWAAVGQDVMFQKFKIMMK